RRLSRQTSHHPPFLLPFPTRRSSDLHLGHLGGGIDRAAEDAGQILGQHIAHGGVLGGVVGGVKGEAHGRGGVGGPVLLQLPLQGDRKSTRLNSSHVSISYAVFCLNKN